MSKKLLCTDNRFELIDEAKKRMIESTNIESNPKEMAVIDNILFRIWQMGWLDKALTDTVPVVRCKDCKHFDTKDCADGFGWCKRNGTGHGSTDDWFCADGERREKE